MKVWGQVKRNKQKNLKRRKVNMPDFNVELMDIQRIFAVTDTSTGKDYTVIEMWNENTQTGDWEVTSPEDEEISEELQDLLIDAVINSNK